MIDEGKDCVRSPAMNQAFIVDESSQVPKKECIHVLSPVGLMATYKRDLVGNAKPEVEITDNISHKGTAGVRVDGVEAAEGAVVTEECCGHGQRSVVSDRVCDGEFGVMLDDEKETDVAIFVVRGDRYVIDAYGTCMV